MTVSARRARSHEEYLATRYFPTLDGIRAVSILLVVGLHSRDPFWMSLHGTVGVTIFFVLSGFLITTLLLREEAARGRADILRFFGRRAFRLLPVYFTVLAAFVVLIGLLHVEWGRKAFLDDLPYYLTYQNDFAPTSLFGHTWSLAVEEKFYVLWPLIGFSLLPVRQVRLPALLALLVVTVVGELSGAAYLATYTPLVLGCLVAVVLHSPRGWRSAAPLRAPVVLVLVLALAAVQSQFDPGWQGHVHTLFALLVALALPGLLVAERGFGRLLSAAPLRYVGTRSYALYLLHPLVIAAVGYLVAPGSTSRPREALHLGLILLCSLAGAEVLHRCIERPMIAFGRRLLRGATPARVAPAAVSVADPFPGGQVAVSTSA